MEVMVNIPDKLKEKIGNQWGDLSTKIIHNLVLMAFLDGLINLSELREMLHLKDNDDFSTFLRENHLLHNSGLLNLYGSCQDIDFADNSLGIVDNLANEMMGAFDE
ncbi:MAG: hypothetical protein GW795_15755 [Cyanobacteria bacterium]|jgi:hypothetical protein|nr:hypothetical protein [Cyanobacteria bacterium CG_2015-16_32_12]NCO79644.1 hypothetical protein [Cyanobacteria bacterium CG_2015-22_32_23]NCQ05833.1 hypothetical protein [Cyanobacteria bacterium CG_2015-09_32_10]NCQ43280.1 hypothetical protein [Cyanobacteria bacterium CG_2015-04_32_10]